jgi:hypothetical protein
MVLNEHQLIADSLGIIQQRRAERAPLAMPVILFSATTGSRSRTGTGTPRSTPR